MSKKIIWGKALWMHPHFVHTDLEMLCSCLMLLLTWMIFIKVFYIFFMKTLTNFQGSYLEGISKGIGGLTQKVKSWYWGRPLVSLECLLCVQTCKNPFILRTMISDTSRLSWQYSKLSTQTILENLPCHHSVSACVECTKQNLFENLLPEQTHLRLKCVQDYLSRIYFIESLIFKFLMISSEGWANW